MLWSRGVDGCKGAFLQRGRELRASFQLPRVGGSQGGEIFGLCPPAPHFARLPSQLKSEPQRPVFSHRQLEKAFIFQAPARPGKGVVLLFIGGEVSGEGKVLPYCTPTPGKSL